MHAFWGVLYWGSLLQACVTSVIQGVGVTLGIQKSLAGGQEKIHLGAQKNSLV